MTINNKGVLPAIGLGMMAGAALMVLANPKPELKKKAEKAVKTVGQVAENLTDAMKM